MFEGLVPSQKLFLGYFLIYLASEYFERCKVRLQLLEQQREN